MINFQSEGQYLKDVFYLSEDNPNIILWARLLKIPFSSVMFKYEGKQRRKRNTMAF